jgi:two-component system phosphate regulon sensor histidine kinase PhoR
VEIEQTSPVRVLRGRAVPLGMDEIALLVEDITDLRALETVRQQFVANLSHELRTPLAGLDLAAQTLAAQLGPDSPERVFVDRILKESQRLTAMVTNLTQLAALDAEAVRPQQEVFAVRPLLDDQAARSAERARAAGLTLEVNCPQDLRARGDAAKTDQALHNILDNALKFTVAGGVVLTGRLDGMVEISVRDTGVGIAPRDLPRIFERFYKADRARSAGGTGLGLAIARHLVELQDGTLRAESTPGAGTILRLRLPAADGGG